MNIDIEKIALFIKTVAHEEILPKYKNLKDDEIACKTSKDDLVTVVDKNSEAALTKLLCHYIPGSKVLGEEGVYKNPADADLVDADGYVWIVDPLDGTKNFTSGSEHFGIIVCLLKDRQPIAGWIYTPILGVMTMGELGSGVFADHKKIHINHKRNIITDFDIVYDFDSANLADFARSLKFLWCSAVEYQWLLTGKIDAGFFCGEIKPWDHVAGLFLHKEAGGYNALLNGTPYNNHSCPKKDIPILLAPSYEVWQELKNRIKYPLHT